MLPVLFEIGPVTIYSFGAVVFLGFVIASFLAFRRLKDENLEENDIFDLILFVGFIGFVFSRIFYVAFHFERFGFDLVKILNFGRFVGFSFWGVVFGGFLGVWMFSKKQELDFFKVADSMIVPLLVFSIFVQIGCFFNGCNLGWVTRAPWGLMMPGTLQRRHPVFLYEACLLLIVLLYFMRIEKRWRGFEWYKSKKQGFLFFIFLALYSLLQSILDLFREDNLYFRGLNLSLWIPLFLGLIFLSLLALRSERVFREDLRFGFKAIFKKFRGGSGKEERLNKEVKILKEEDENIVSKKDSFSD